MNKADRERGVSGVGVVLSVKRHSFVVLAVFYRNLRAYGRWCWYKLIRLVSLPPRGIRARQESGTMPYSATKIANVLIRMAAAEGRWLTPLQLIKLVYISHGWSLALLDKPLVNEPAQAWQYGPVVPSLYHALKAYRSNPVTNEIVGDSDPQNLDERAQWLLRSVFDRYKHLSGTQLSSLTHMPDTPWSTVWTTKGKNSIIPDDLIHRHYVARATAAQ